MHEHAAARGYACLVCRTHAVEVHDLPEPAAIAFMQDLRSVSKALSATTGAIKLNHEIHGNTLPHLHVHIYPRYIGDRFGDGPIDPRAVVPAVYGTGEFMCLRNAVIAALSRPRDNGVPCTD